ncbi:MAG: hypothetical protein Q8N26_35515 [Myxococcales bacterium]|nr:hypothetical protein [Myxococcales bacterium]
MIDDLLKPWGLLPLAVPLVLVAANGAAWLVLAVPPTARCSSASTRASPSGDG